MVQRKEEKVGLVEAQIAMEIAGVCGKNWK